MVYEVKNHLLYKDGKLVTQKKSPNHGGTMKPTLLVYHYTATQNGAGAISWLCNPNAKASAQLVLDQKGEVTQLMPLNVVAWHAGVSSWKRKSGCNGFSIGIEMVNPGFLTKRADGKFYDCNGKVVDPSMVIFAKHKNGGNERPWMAYTPEQIDAAIRVGAAIRMAYPITDVVGHEDIAPKRKTDPGPAFPLAKVASAIMGRK